MDTASEAPLAFAYDEDEKSLIITWPQDTLQKIPFRLLRQNCPCATCHGEFGRPGRFAINPTLLDGEDNLVDIALVGNYGICPTWADGHATGIFTYSFLRDLGGISV